MRTPNRLLKCAAIAKGPQQQEAMPHTLTHTIQSLSSYTLNTAAQTTESSKCRAKKGNSSHLVRVLEQLRRVGAVVAAEDNGGGGHGGSGLSGEVGSRVARVDSVSGSRRRHVLRPLPAVVVGGSISNLTNSPQINLHIWEKKKVEISCADYDILIPSKAKTKIVLIRVENSIWRLN